MVNRTRNDEGNALVLSLVAMVMLVGVSFSHFLVSRAGAEAAGRDRSIIRARLAADEGLHRAMAEVKSGIDTDGDGLGALSWIGPDGRRVEVSVVDLGGDLYRFRSQGTVHGVTQGAEAIVEVIVGLGFNAPARAAITAEGSVSTTGNIEVDGRDWDDTGSVVEGPGVFGISSVDSISINGSSTVGGHGLAPSHPGDPSSKEAHALWYDSEDNDGDGAIDEESFDGIDNDGDGEVDEDTNDYPTSADVFFGVPEGTLKATAQAAGTYFASESALNAYIAANGGSMPGGAVIYCEFDLWQPAALGDTPNDDPSILIHTNSSRDALMKNIHGSFKGFVLANLVTHINGDCRIVGGFMSFADESFGNAFGNGSAEILYSSSVLSGLPGSSTSVSQVRIRSWSRSGVQ